MASKKEEVSLSKRTPFRLPTRKNDLYITRNSEFAAQLDRAQKLLDSGLDEIFIHGLGAAINRAINLALRLQEHYKGTVQVSTNTSTIELVDDIEPTDATQLPGEQRRNNSAVHIRVYRLSAAK
eukprot:Opistho-2@17760